MKIIILILLILLPMLARAETAINYKCSVIENSIVCESEASSDTLLVIGVIVAESLLEMKARKITEKIKYIHVFFPTGITYSISTEDALVCMFTEGSFQKSLDCMSEEIIVGSNT